MRPSFFLAKEMASFIKARGLAKTGVKMTAFSKNNGQRPSLINDWPMHLYNFSS